MKTIAIEYSTSGRNKVIDIGPLHLVYTVHRVHIEYSTSGKNKVIDIGLLHLVCKSIEEKYLVDEISLIFFLKEGGAENSLEKKIPADFFPGILNYIKNSLYCWRYFITNKNKVTVQLFSIWIEKYDFIISCRLYSTCSPSELSSAFSLH